MEVLVIFVIFFFLVVVGAPIGVALLMSAMIPMGIFTDTSLTVIIQRLFQAVNSYSLMAIPFFLLAGGLLEKGGVSRRLVNLANALMGWLPGGLAVVTFIASAFFGAISGSSVATVAAIGSIIMPYMLEDGYSRAFTLATIASGGWLGIIIPPSIPMVLYGMSTGVSVGDMFLAGVIPGIMLALGMGVYAIIFGIKSGSQLKTHKFSLKALGKAFVDAIWAIIMPVIVLGGIYGGIFTPTEAAAVSCVYGFFVGLVIYKELNFQKIIKIFRGAVVSTSMIMFIVAGATAFGYLLTYENVPNAVTVLIQSFCHTRFQFLLVVTIFLFIVGMVMDTPPAILVCAPLLQPIALSYGIDGVAFGMYMIINLGIGLTTPPVGMNLYVAAGLQKDSVGTVVNKHLLVYIFCSMIILIILMCFPDIVLFLPRLSA